MIPDVPGTLDGLDATVAFLDRERVPYRIDPIIEPIGFGFAASLGRYLEVRRRYPDAEILMGVGNLTELTEVDSAGVNAVLIGFCEELGIRSVLTTAVINWARSSVREIDIARRLAHHAVSRRALPKHVDPRLVMLRDPRIAEFGEANLAELQARIRDPNWRIFAEGGAIHALNNQHLLRDLDPFRLFAQMGIGDPSHAFYLGYEMMKARTALTLSKTYRQDQALEWGFLTQPEAVRIARRDSASAARPADRGGRKAGRHPTTPAGRSRDTRRHRDNPELGRPAQRGTDGARGQSGGRHASVRTPPLSIVHDLRQPQGAGRGRPARHG